MRFHPGVMLRGESGKLMIGNGETFTARDYIDPDLIHTIEITPDAPLHCRSLHTVGKTTFDCFDVAVVGTVEFSQPNVFLCKLN